MPEQREGRDQGGQADFPWYHVTAYCSFFITSLFPQFFVRFVLILFCFIVFNLVSVLFLFYFLQCPLRLISS
jgi:hypothetical protein